MYVFMYGNPNQANYNDTKISFMIDTHEKLHDYERHFSTSLVIVGLKLTHVS